MAVELLQSGAQSATFLWTFSEFAQQYADWAALPNGKLKDILNRTYLTAENLVDVDAFWRSFGSAGGSTTSLGYLGPSIASPVWILSDGGFDEPPKGTPTLRQTTPEGTKILVRVQVSYSASE